MAEDNNLLFGWDFCIICYWVRHQSIRKSLSVCMYCYFCSDEEKFVSYVLLLREWVEEWKSVSKLAEVCIECVEWLTGTIKRTTTSMRKRILSFSSFLYVKFCSTATLSEWRKERHEKIVINFHIHLWVHKTCVYICV